MSEHPKPGDAISKMRNASTIPGKLERDLNKFERSIPDGWQGTQPAQGTRRALIRDAVWNAIKGWDIGRVGDKGYAGATGTDSLVIADEVESALLQTTIAEECTDTPPPIVELKEQAEERLRRVARIIENGEVGGRTGEAIIDSIKANVLDKAGVDTGPDPAWIRDKADFLAIAEILEEDRPDWAKIDAIADLVDVDVNRSDDDAFPVQAPADDIDRLYTQREEARAGEGRFKEERDAAFALLRWLLPVTVARPLSEIGEDD
jgi:hypothetical protein